MRKHIRHAVVVAAAAGTLGSGLLASSATAAESTRTATETTAKMTAQTVKATKPKGPAATRYPDDFNGDGYPDLAMSEPRADLIVPGTAEKENAGWGAGYVTVSYGSKYGAQRTGLKIITQDSPGVPGRAELNNGFGDVLANGDFNGDGYADLAVAASWQDTAAESDDQGTVTLLWGSPSGLKGGVSVADNAPVQRGAFGSVLVAGDFNGDRKTDLVIGHGGRLDLFRGPFSATGKPASVTPVDPGFKVSYGSWDNKRLAAGRINKDAADDLVAFNGSGNEYASSPGRVLLGGSAGLKATPTLLRSGSKPVIADFDKDGYGDIAVGDRAADWETEQTAGRVHITFGSAKGVDTRRRVRVFTEDTPGVPGTPKEMDQFGAVLDVGDLNRDGYPDLIVGAPGENYPACDDGCAPRSGGGVYVLKGSPKGVVATGAAFYGRKASGLPAVPKQTVLRFGHELKVTDLNADKQPEIALLVHGIGRSNLWSVGTKKDGTVAGTAPTREVKAPTDPKIQHDYGYGFTLLSR
ncbi:FG-GAP-like repeat-containing protein [Streptomyces sp. NPDC059828]|uniref:FG-GAP-like repeat-containing protein n=1 Tax=Streptomyces sp. NPDC059828 TaxID=3346965 RepID=UPI00365358ED